MYKHLVEADPQRIKNTYGLPFYWTCRFLKKDAVENISMLYAFYRYTKDIAALPNKKKSKELLGKIEEELDAPSHTFMARLNQIIEQLDIPKLYCKEVISAARFETAKNTVVHHNQLIIYCYKNLGALGLMAAPALGACDPKARSFALDMGIGVNLVRICANILEDARCGNVYLPKRELDHLRLSHKELASEGDTPVELKKLVEKYLDLADSYIESSLRGLFYLPFRVRFGVLLAARACQERGAKIRRRDYEVLEGTVRLSAFDKLLAGAKAFTDVLRPRFWHAGKRQGFAHASLIGLPGVMADGASAE